MHVIGAVGVSRRSGVRRSSKDLDRKPRGTGPDARLKPMDPKVPSKRICDLHDLKEVDGMMVSD